MNIYYERNRQKYLDRYEANRDVLIAYQREYDKKRREDDLEGRRAYDRNYYHMNRSVKLYREPKPPKPEPVKKPRKGKYNKNHVSINVEVDSSIHMINLTL